MGGGWVFSGQRNIGVFWAGWGLVGGVGAVGCGVKVRLSAGGSAPLCGVGLLVDLYMEERPWHSARRARLRRL